MEFYSILFICFMSIGLLGYYTIFRKHQSVWLLILSLAFYWYCGSAGLLFICFTGLTTWLGAKGIAKFDGNHAKRKRKTLLFFVLLLNFGLLFYLKYVNVIFSWNKDLIIPLGISFYMFQAMGYLIDVYNNKYEPEKNFAKFLLFISFFPQLIQGPINRYDAMREQYEQVHHFSYSKAKLAMYRIGYGMLKKFAIADILYAIIDICLGCDISGNLLVDAGELSKYPGSVFVVGMFLYAIYQYADFSGGIDMVLGVAELFDIQMAENFRQPYFSVTLAEFWRRWHISLGRWMRDYVFYPFVLTKPMRDLGKWLKKNTSKHLGVVIPTMLGNLVVFFLVGAWHGASWHFVVWGIYNGLLIGLGDLFAPMFKKVNTCLHIPVKSTGMYLFRVVRTFFIVCVGGYFDRICDLNLAFDMMKKSVFAANWAALPEFWHGKVSLQYPIFSIATVCLAILVVFIVSFMKEREIDVRVWVSNRCFITRWIIYVGIISILFISFLSTTTNIGFLYANF